MNCPNCGLAAHETDKFCIGCGTALRRPVPPMEKPAPAEAPAAPAQAVEKLETVAEAEVEAAPAAEKQFESAVAEAEKVFAEEPVLKAEPVIPAPPAANEVKPVVNEPVRPVVNEPVRPVVNEVKPAAAKEAETVSKLDKPLSTWGYIWRILLFSIPVVCIIPLFIMAFSKGVNKNSKHLASAVLILMLVCLLLALGFGIYLVCTNDPAVINDYINNLLNNFKAA